MKRIFQCKICGKEFSAFGIANHIKSHGFSNKEYYDKYLKSEKDGFCYTCGKEVEFTGSILSGYKKHCSSKCACNDPDVRKRTHDTTIKHFGAVGFASALLLEKSRNGYKRKTGFDKPTSNPEVQNKILEKRKITWKKKYGSEHAMQNVNVAKKLKRKYRYDDQMFDSSWELVYYVWLKDNGISFIYQPNKTFTYTYKNITHVYEPDFIVNGECIEIKGDHFFEMKNEKTVMVCPWNHDEDERYEAKHQCMINNNVKILLEKDMMPYFDYVNETYGKDFITSKKVIHETV